MQKKLLAGAALIVVIVIAVILIIPREEPSRFVADLWKNENTSDWGNVKVLDVQDADGYKIVSIQYESKDNFQLPNHWVVKDRTKIEDLGSGFGRWESYVYLIKDGLSSWTVIQ